MWEKLREAGRAGLDQLLIPAWRCLELELYLISFYGQCMRILMVYEGLLFIT